MAQPRTEASPSHKVFVRWRPLDHNAKAEDELTRFYEETNDGRTRLAIRSEQSQRRSQKWDSGASFEEVFETATSNEELFESCVAPVLPEVLNRATCSFFAYGHTGSGKTYTISGDPQTWSIVGDELLGLYLITARWLFAQIARTRDAKPPSEQENDRQIGLGVRMFELRRSKAYDLLDDHKECYIRQGEDGKTHIRSETESLEGGKVRVRPVTQKICWSFEQALQEIRRGLELRSTGTSTLHDRSSRTHAILEMEIVDQCLLDTRHALVEAESELVPVGKNATGVFIEEMSQSLLKTEDGNYIENPARPTDHARIAAAEAEKKLYEGYVESAQQRALAALEAPSVVPLGGKVVFADLAGAEFYSSLDTPENIPRQTAQERQEGRQINSDLLALKEVIRAWSTKRSHVPFRSSSLTMVLREHFLASESSFSGTILTVSPASSHSRATMNTLKYGKLIGEGAIRTPRTLSSSKPKSCKA